MTQDRATCPHMDFESFVNVFRLTDVGRFSAEIAIRCRVCQEPFRFIGCTAGYSPYEPSVSIDSTKLIVPIEPEGTPKISSGARYEMPPRREDKES